MLFNMTSSKINDSDLRKQFLQYLNQPELCEQFYIYMKSEHLAYVLEFYLACDGLRNLLDDISKQGAIIELIYKHYLSNGKYLSSSSKTKFSLSDDLIISIKQRLIKHEYHLKFYDQAQEYVLKYMLQMCYPKFLIEQQQKEENELKKCQILLNTPKFSPMHKRSMTSRKKDVFEQLKQKTNQRILNTSAPIKISSHIRQHPIEPSSLEASTLIADHDAGLNISKQPRTTKLTKQQKDQYSLAQRDPAAFFEEIKKRLLAYQAENSSAAKIRGISQSFNVQNKVSFIDHRTVDDDSLAVLDSQIAKTIDDADNYLFETIPTTKITQRYRLSSIIKHQENKDYSLLRNSFTRSDSGVGTDTSEKNYEIFRYQHGQHLTSIDVIWYASLDSNNALLSTIPRIHDHITFKEFRQLFKKQPIYRYFFKTTCTPDINKEQYVFRELTMDDELVPFYDGKIFVQLDRIS
ncbi:unnamed protein product [Rotaria sordida]|uniref:Axin n=1 Tax=Rotaria sordida TaxID=392033 RepID=A0A813QNJ8_9BILA|nr:unnamed protein product [Rotaria sordida]CAF0829574.1 unnamed protein product [Rotaria sordida]CAF0865859.1 unnamed protein product [Rotaria sordida]